jgi:galactokinase
MQGQMQPLTQGAARLAGRFRRLSGRSPDGVWRAPGRVNLIGEHTDYNAGFALPFAIDHQTLVAVGRRSDRQVRCWSAQDDATAEANLEALDRDSARGWARYPVGVFWALDQAGVDLPGADILVDSAVPVGRGLSSSAALLAAVAVALDELTGTGFDRYELARLCHTAETRFVGAPVGMLDQFAVLCARADHGLLIDFRSQRMEAVPLAIGPLVVVDTRVRHSNADNGYAARRRSCEQAAFELGVTDLRDATQPDVERRLDGDLRRRARHVVSENERVLAAAGRLGAGEEIGDLLYASHASLRDDFEVSCAELDAVVECSRQCGASGARLTGAGFGGSAIVRGIEAGELTAALEREFRDKGLRPPITFPVIPSGGAERVT